MITRVVTNVMRKAAKHKNSGNRPESTSSRWNHSLTAAILPRPHGPGTVVTPSARTADGGPRVPDIHRGRRRLDDIRGGYAGGMTDRGCARVGCSGWQYRDWRGVVYPPEVPQRSWLRHYATLFDTVEVNNSFYRLPSESAVSGWAASVPPGFVFALKLGAFGSHRMKLRDAASWLPNHMVRVKLLGDAAGPTLVQLPPRWRRNAERLDEFLERRTAHDALGRRATRALLAAR